MSTSTDKRLLVQTQKRFQLPLVEKTVVQRNLTQKPFPKEKNYSIN